MDAEDEPLDDIDLVADSQVVGVEDNVSVDVEKTDGDAEAVLEGVAEI